ncbi:MAG TPA: tyrosine--tRNA ligase [Dehalococcoidia bacterium]|nr:tyrosine--tRNA ligase [Dehalococcoidia bacterium]
MTARIPSDAELDWLTNRAVAEIIPRDQFVRALQSGKPLRLKMGFDPSAPDLTLGHAVGLRKLRQLQDLGHTVVVIVGDWTARIGDPSGRSKTRPMLTVDEVNENAETYLRQFFKIVDREHTEVRRQTEWFDAFTLTDVVQLAGKFTVAQMMERDDFAQRWKAGHPIGVHEFLYPLLQAYDSVAIKADVEFGGTDQKFNLHVGRELQPMFGQPSQAIFLVPLLIGTDGKDKMSKSVGNYIALEEPPGEMFGKVMSIPDHLIVDYFDFLTDIPGEDVAAIRESLEKRAANPMTHKLRLAREIVAQFHSPESAEAAQSEFQRVFSDREQPGDVPEYAIKFEDDPMAVDLVDLLAASGLAASRSEARRLVSQGAVEVDGARATEARCSVRPGSIVRAGKHRFLRLISTRHEPGS